MVAVNQSTVRQVGRYINSISTQGYMTLPDRIRKSIKGYNPLSMVYSQKGARARVATASAYRYGAQSEDVFPNT